MDIYVYVYVCAYVYIYTHVCMCIIWKPLDYATIETVIVSYSPVACFTVKLEWVDDVILSQTFQSNDFQQIR